MRDERREIVLVADSHGATVGLVTLEDLLEELVGEIEDEPLPAANGIVRGAAPPVLEICTRTPILQIRNGCHPPCDSAIQTAGAGVKQEHIVTFRRTRLRRTAITFIVLVLTGVLVAPIAATTVVVDRSSTVDRATVDPAPDSVLSVGSQIRFGGVPAHHLRVTPTGSSSGFHTGILHPGHDGLRATLVPDRPLSPGETLDVKARSTEPSLPESNFNPTVGTRTPR